MVCGPCLICIMKPVIEIRNISKMYTVDVTNRQYKSISETVTNFFTGKKKQEFELWALKDITLDVYPGESIGVIGSNGSGKSTLLKILSKISPPTKGKINLRGNVASLIEVGTGFHPELNGQENIFLNGSILGLPKSEIINKFDEIVAFSGVGKFLQTPLKHYSSGMQLRLAFSVAAHLDPSILLVDEVLAVGDAEFQKKCLNKMMEVTSQDGRTVMFVSHNLEAVQKLCRKTVHIEKGVLKNFGPTHKVIHEYLNQEKLAPKKDIVIDLPENLIAPQFKSVSIKNHQIKYGETITLDIQIVAPENSKAGIEIDLKDQSHFPISHSSTSPMQGNLLELKANEVNHFEVKIESLQLAAGSYNVFLKLTHPWTEDFHQMPNALKFEVVHSDPFDTGFSFQQSNRGSIHHTLSTKRITPRKSEKASNLPHEG